jgi:hypothetical protein
MTDIIMEQRNKIIALETGLEFCQSALITHRKALEAIDKKIYGVPQ